MARKPNYQFERAERERAKANKLAEKAEAKRREREANREPSDDVEAHGGDQPGED